MIAGLANLWPGSLLDFFDKDGLPSHELQFQLINIQLFMVEPVIHPFALSDHDHEEACPLDQSPHTDFEDEDEDEHDLASKTASRRQEFTRANFRAFTPAYGLFLLHYIQILIQQLADLDDAFLLDGDFRGAGDGD